MEIKELFDKTFETLPIDSSFVRKIKVFTNTFVNKGEHAAFFGSGLLAVHRVRWTSVELKDWFDNIVKCDMDELKENIDNLDNIDPTHIVTTDAFNLTTVYMVHRILTSPNLRQNDKVQCAINIIEILHFKFVCGILSSYFPYGTDPQIALRTFEAMNYKFDLKVYKTWGRLIKERAKSAVDPSSIHYKTFIQFADDDAVKYILSDIQTRIRVVIKTLTALYYKVKEEGDRVFATSTMVEVDGGLEVRDINRMFPQYRRYINDTISDTPSFIRQELVDLICKTNPSVNRKHLVDTLTYISVQCINGIHSGPARGIKSNKIREYLDRTLEYAFDFVHSRGINPQNLAELISGLKGVLNASRNKERDVMYLRSEGDKIVRSATGRASPTPVSGERTGMIIYIVVRTLTMKYYQRNG